jgi:hypothetical protein
MAAKLPQFISTVPSFTSTKTTTIINSITITYHRAPQLHSSPQSPNSLSVLPSSSSPITTRKPQPHHVASPSPSSLCIGSTQSARSNSIPPLQPCLGIQFKAKSSGLASDSITCNQSIIIATPPWGITTICHSKIKPPPWQQLTQASIHIQK